MNGDADWLKPKALSYRMYTMLGSNPEKVRMYSTSGKHQIDDKVETAGIIEPGGWHLSYFGSVETVKQKILNMAHQEFNNKEVAEDPKGIMAKTGERVDLFKRGVGKSHLTIKHVPIAENPYLPREIEYLQELWGSTEDLVGGLAQAQKEEL
jgi:hypothetical protein